MAERTEELTESDDAGDYEDPEARAAMAEAQSVIDRVQSGGTDGVGGSGDVGGSGATPGDSAAAGRESEESGGVLPSLSRPSLPRPSLPSLSLPSVPAADELFSKWSFGFALVATLVGFSAGTFLLPLGPLGGALGVLAAAFLFGLLNPRRAYLEATVVFALVGGLAAFFTNLTVAAATGRGVPIFVVGAAIALVAGLVGYYFGRDLRAGLAREIP